MGQSGASPRPLTDRARPSGRDRLVRRTAGVAATLTMTLGGVALAPADAANPVTPGDFTGYGFDQCMAPTSTTMKTWWNSSPYTAVGIYISGASRGCRDQPNLTADWVTAEQKLGWRLLAITVGPQASCQARYANRVRISSSKSGDYAKARQQGTDEASKTVRNAARLGIAKGSVLWYDLEAFDTSNRTCTDSAMAFLSGWTKQLRSLGYAAGAYSSAASGIKAMAAASNSSRFTIPEYAWIADWNGRPDTHTQYVSDSYWKNHRRVHQYKGGHNETYGGATINIDTNFLDVGKGSVAPTPKPHQRRIDYKTYPTIKPTDTSKSAIGYTKVVQALLTELKFYTGPIDGNLDSPAMTKAIAAFRKTKSLPTGANWRTTDWQSALSRGSSAVVKYGTVGEGVRRLQRALNVGGAKLTITGIADMPTMTAVAAYRKRVGFSQVQLVDTATWLALKAGK